MSMWERGAGVREPPRKVHVSTADFVKDVVTIGTETDLQGDDWLVLEGGEKLPLRGDSISIVRVDEDRKRL